MHSLRLAIYESAVLQLSKQEAILSAHSMYKVERLFSLCSIIACLRYTHFTQLNIPGAPFFNYNTCISSSKLPVPGLNMDDNWKTIISSQSAELVERISSSKFPVLGLNMDDN